MYTVPSIFSNALDLYYFGQVKYRVGNERLALTLYRPLDLSILITHMSPFSQDINESANIRFLQRLSVIFCFHQDFRDLVLPAETVVLGK